MIQRSTRRVLLAACVAANALLSLGQAGAQSPPVATVPGLATLPPGASSPPARCAFPFIVDAENLNLAYPDPNATHWAMPFTLDAGESLLVHGTYPSSRFMAVTLYDLGDSASQAVIIRNMLPSSTFPHAVQDVTPSTYGVPSDAASVMEAD